METENFEAKKKELLNKLVLKKEDTLEELDTLIEMSKNFLMIESETGEIVFNKERKFANKEKILLSLIGKYFAKEVGILENDCVTLATLSKELDIVNTTLSKPIKEILSSGAVKKNANGEYYIVYHQIKSVLQNIK